MKFLKIFIASSRINTEVNSDSIIIRADYSIIFTNRNVCRKLETIDLYLPSLKNNDVL